MDIAKLAAILQALLGAPNMTLVTSGTFVVRGDRLECVVGHLKLVELRRTVRITCEP